MPYGTTATGQKVLGEDAGRIFSIRDRKKLAERIKKLIDRYGVPEFLNKRDAFLLRCTKLLVII